MISSLLPRFVRVVVRVALSDGDDFPLLVTLLKVALPATQSLDLVFGGRDVVPLKDRNGPMPRDGHGNRLRGSAADHVSNGRPFQVMEELSGQLRLFARRAPLPGEAQASRSPARSFAIRMHLDLARS
jgi:hypothetical protein